MRGEGIEIGALNAPLPLPPGARARYVDQGVPAELAAGGYLGVVAVKAPDLIADVETLAGIDDRSLDFVIANHVLEHVEDPLRALATINRVLRSNGIAFIAFPDKRFTFDKERPITPVWHVAKDFREGPEWSRHEHYVDYVVHVDRARDVQAIEVSVARNTGANAGLGFFRPMSSRLRSAE